jgi:hypothetical protein
VTNQRGLKANTRGRKKDMRIYSKTGLLRLAMASLLIFALSAAAGCGDDDDTGGGGSGAAGSGGGGSGDGDLVPMGAIDCPNTDPPYDDPYCNNLNCPELAPMTGELAPKGSCCYRLPAQVAADELLEPGEGGPLGYAVVFYRVKTQPNTVGSDIVAPFMKATLEAGYDTLLMRINGVIPEDEAPEGPMDVVVDIGSGRRHCDGTYSFYGPGAAPEHEGRDDADRWNVRTMTGTWDWGEDPYLTIDEEGRYRGLSWAPRWTLSPDGEVVIDYEQPARNLDLTIPNESRDEEGNCVGKRLTDQTWEGPEALTTFVPLKQAKETVSRVVSQTICSILANNVGGCPCEDERVCNGEPWVEPPDSVCPDEETDETPCWIGVKTHPNFDAERDCNDSDRTCCDPLGQGTDGLPACNAWYTSEATTLASVPIRTVIDGEKWVWRDHDYPEDEVLITTPEDAPPPTCTE